MMTRRELLKLMNFALIPGQTTAATPENCPLGHSQLPVLFGRVVGYGAQNGSYADPTGNTDGFLAVGDKKACAVCGVEYITWIPAVP